MAPETQRPGDAARRLLRAADRGALATSLAGGAEAAAGGWPYASLVLLACDHDAAPLLLISDLAEHSKNIADDPRVGLLIDGTAGRIDPLAGPRTTILGTAEKTDDARFKARFVARHPSAALYADFADFHLYRVAVTRAHFVAGFGRIHWIDAADFVGDTAGAPLAESEEELIRQWNGRAELADRMAQLATGRRATGWRVTGLDREGIDLRRDGIVARLEFPTPADSADAAAQAVDNLLGSPKPKRRR
ncbi:MAG: HugZ family protein [Dongiaceae bacterium]